MVRTREFDIRETGFDRLCAKELFAPDKRRKNAAGKWEVTAQGTMSRLQEDFWEQVAKLRGAGHERRRLQEDFWEQVAKPYGYRPCATSAVLKATGGLLGAGREALRVRAPLRHERRAKGYRRTSGSRSRSPTGTSAPAPRAPC